MKSSEELSIMASTSTCCSSRSSSSSQSHDEQHIFGNLVTGLCCHYHVDKYILEIHTEEELWRVAISCRIPLALLYDKSDQIVGSLQRPSVVLWFYLCYILLCFSGTFVLFYGCPGRDTSLCISVQSNSRMSHVKFWHRGTTCLALSAATGLVSYRFFSSVVCVFVLEAGIHEVARRDSGVLVQLLVWCIHFRFQCITSWLIIRA